MTQPQKKFMQVTVSMPRELVIQLDAARGEGVDRRSRSNTVASIVAAHLAAQKRTAG